MSLEKSFAPQLGQLPINWEYMVERRNGITLEEAEQYALENDTITYFMRIRENSGMTVPDQPVLNAGDTVFFKGTPTYNFTNSADSYEKKAGFIKYVLPQGTYFLGAKGGMTAPDAIPNIGNTALFLWLGLQPGNLSHNQADAIGNGVLQPVLSYGNSCAPNPTNLPYNQWWISGQYVNTSTDRPAKYNGPNGVGCNGGERMSLVANERVDVVVEYNATTDSWEQYCIANKGRVSYKIQLEINGDTQRQSFLVIGSEPKVPVPAPGQTPILLTSTSMFDIRLTTNIPCPSLLNYLQSLDYVQGARIGDSDTEIKIDRIVYSSPLYPNSVLNPIAG